MSSIALRSKPMADSANGASETSIELRKILIEAFDHFHVPDVTKTQLDWVLEDIWQEFFSHQEDGWDGYDALPASVEAALNAEQFMRSLPVCVSCPEVEVEPDGEIALEWYGRDDSVFSISFGKSDLFAYAGRFDGERRTHGKDRLINGEPPAAIIDYIRQII